MLITVNGVTQEVAPNTTVATLVSAHINKPLDHNFQPCDGGRLAMAVAVNQTVIPRSQWGMELTPGCCVDLVTAVQGG